MILKDLETVEKALDKAKKQARFGTADDRVAAEAYEVALKGLNEGRIAHAIELSDEHRAALRTCSCSPTSRRSSSPTAPRRTSRVRAISTSRRWRSTPRNAT